MSGARHLISDSPYATAVRLLQAGADLNMRDAGDLIAALSPEAGPEPRRPGRHGRHCCTGRGHPRGHAGRRRGPVRPGRPDQCPAAGQAQPVDLMASLAELQRLCTKYAELSFPDSTEIDAMSESERQYREHVARSAACRIADLVIEAGLHRGEVLP